MYRVTDAQIEYILNDIKQRGVEMEDLQQNLLDHVCCMLEQNCKNDKDFETEYEKAIKQFFKTELWEIEEETILLLKYKHYYKMKRFLYILLFLSVSYNIYVFGRMGYEFYQHRIMFREGESYKTTSFQEGYQKFISDLKKEDPISAQKNYICVYFIGDPMSKYEKEHYPIEIGDSASWRENKLLDLQKLRRIDSMAAATRNRMTIVFAYKKDHAEIDKSIAVRKHLFKNVIFLKDQHALYSGHVNEHKKGQIFTTLFVLDKNGKIVFDCKYIINEDVFLQRFLKTLPRE
jgi:hypothetical protein